MTSGTLRHLRWATTVLYATALLGALIVPHEHGFPGASCGCCHSTEGCDSSTCHVGHDHEHGDHNHNHNHGGHGHKHVCSHDHHSDPAPQSSDELPASDHDCPYCRFLAQPVQLTAPPAVLATAETLAAAPMPAAIIVERTLPTIPPVRGPPAC
ncbi:MAG: hypothetical protein KDA75_12150 [Planctomycetaceae bacterium]|nr:hypothetical protein [Planctomycetaceae bacterium]